MQQSSVYFVSLGCPKNLVDSQVMLGILEKDKYRISKTPADAEVIIVNTCSFIQSAKEESIETILEMAEHKESGACKALVVTGCMAQRYWQDLEKELPEVDLMLGTGQYHKISEVLLQYKKARNLGEPLPKRSYIDQPAFIHTEADPRMATGPGYTAFLKISEGCNRRCSFCIIPKLRGNVRSRSVQSLVAEATALASRGVKELNLVAQDLTEYGMEGRYRERLETLLPALCRVDGIEWIRLHYVYPDQFSDELLEIIASEPKIVKYLDMPIQHTSDRVLKRMNRRLTRDSLFTLVEKIRKKIPGIAFRTSIIVGFPGETEEEFEQLGKDLVALDLDHVGVFRYSQEEGTPAAALDGAIPMPVRRRRLTKLTGLLKQQSERKSQSRLGKRVPVLLEGTAPETENLLQGRLSIQAQEIDGRVLINDWQDETLVEGLSPGDFLEVEITEAHGPDYLAKAVARLGSRLAS